MIYKILLHPKAKIFLNKLNKETKIRIKKKLKELEKFPDKKGNHLRYSAFWRLRVGDYRIIYEIDRKDRKIIVLFIGHRKNVYDDFSKLF
ncbi:MAG: type II toxin-antitoxin system RelE/ParE family toxin [Candidatus Aenigmarchaeota archaeon]|nr:type II toxin-antitoxin system RelE/ParE family toxin [Candidatus Aenigmarchaeota archaeon]